VATICKQFACVSLMVLLKQGTPLLLVLRALEGADATQQAAFDYAAVCTLCLMSISIALHASTAVLSDLHICGISTF
jgi:hypothetical protein